MDDREPVPRDRDDAAPFQAGWAGPPAAAVLRRGLLVWGAGHLAIGQSGGWLLLALQPLAIALVAVLAVVFVDGSRWIAVFPALMLLITTWIGQAMHAHRQAVQAGAPAGGEFQIAILLPLVVALLSGFWLLGGGRASPAATLQHYVAAWQADRPEAAVPLFAQPVRAEGLAASWQAQRQYVEQLVDRAAQEFGAQAGLDPAQPFNSLRFEERTPRAAVDQAVVRVDVVRRRRVETNLLGLIPTATQETVLVERLGHVRLRAEAAPLPDWLPLAQSPSRIWLIEELDIASGD